MRGEIAFISDTRINPSLMGLDATLRSMEWEGDITDNEEGGISIAIHLLISNYTVVIDFLERKRQRIDRIHA